MCHARFVPALEDQSRCNGYGRVPRDLDVVNNYLRNSPGESIMRSVKVRVSAELGRSRLPIAQVVNLPPGSIVALDRRPDDPIDVLVNGRPFAEAKLVLVDGEFAVQIVNIVPQQAAASEVEEWHAFSLRTTPRSCG